MMLRGNDINRGAGRNTFQKKKQYVDTRSLYCNHFAKLGHSRDTCHKIHGYPNWFKDMTKKRKKVGPDARVFNAVAADIVAVPQHDVTNQSMTVMMSELLQLVKGKTKANQSQMHFGGFVGEFTGILSLGI
ncbi:UNVERIFIED_CONTAM: hypothetical protein Sradi_2328300 [Sesamum radiatum]|uniref:Uncharacterized protein n=1 Tax=Sesamum radiatum TaxID=300843 RepID=A0AAW2T4U9_SESRA